MISIIIISLNTKEDFIRSIKSAIAQTKKSEIIVVDGVSRDGTIKEIYKYKNHIDKIIIKKDSGIYSAMNNGIKAANGKWIYFLNSGDIFYSKKSIENVLNIIKKKNKFDIIVGNSFIKIKTNKFKSPRKRFNKNTYMSCFSHQSTFVRLKYLKIDPFNTKNKYTSDYEFFLKLFLKKKNFKYIHNFISINKSGGASDTNRIEVLNEFNSINNKYNYRFNSNMKINFLIFYNYIMIILKKLLPENLLQDIVILKNKLFS